MNVNKPIPSSKTLHILELSLFIIIYLINQRSPSLFIYIILLFYFEIVGKMKIKNLVFKILFLVIFRQTYMKNWILWISFFCNLKRPRRLSKVGEINEKVEKLKI